MNVSSENTCVVLMQHSDIRTEREHEKKNYKKNLLCGDPITEIFYIFLPSSNNVLWNIFFYAFTRHNFY